MSNSADIVTLEERQKVYKLCKTQMGGIWDDIEEEIIIIKTFANGAMNKIYYVEIPNLLHQFNPIVVKICENTEYDEWFSPLVSTINHLVLSENKISPKAYRIFNNGMITQFIKNRAFNHKDELNTEFASVLAKKLAKFHSLQMPITKDGTKQWLENISGKWFEQRLKQAISEGAVKKSIQESEILSKVDFGAELEWVKGLILSKNHPIMFTHCDFNRGNILVQEKGSEFDIFFIDFDFSQYNFRGYDMGMFFANWGFKGDIFEFNGFPTDQQMSIFIDPYIKESVKILGNSYSENIKNSKEFITNEAKLFSLFAFLVDILFLLETICFTCDEKPDKYNEFLSKAEIRTKGYLSLKKQFLDQNFL